MSERKKSIFENVSELVESTELPPSPEKPGNLFAMAQAAFSSRLFFDQLLLLQQAMELSRFPNPAFLSGLPQLNSGEALLPITTSVSKSASSRSPAFPTIASAPNSNGTVLVLATGDASPAPLQQLPPQPPSKSSILPSPVPSDRPLPPRFQCPDCSRSYSTFSGLSKHRQFHCTSQLKRQFACKYCEKEYCSLGALKMHIRTHTLPCKCGVCGKAFSRPWLLQGHLRTHTGEKPFTCGHCSRSFADRSNLRAHLQTHSQVKKYRCTVCAKTFSRISLLHKHQANGCPAASTSLVIAQP